MRRREFVAGLAGAALTIPRGAYAQLPSIPIVGCLDSRSRDAAIVAALVRGFSEMGYVEGRNLAIEYRWADDRNEHLPELAVDLVRRNVAVIVAPGSSLAARAAQAATTLIPIVFGIGADPVKLGLVASFNHPGGNITGIVRQSHEVAAKRLKLLNDLVPLATPIAVLNNPANPASGDEVRELEAAARVLGLPLAIFNASNNKEIEKAFATLVEKGYRSLTVVSDSFFFGQDKHIIALAARYSLPATYPYRSYAQHGGLLSYGADYIDSYRLVATYAGRILKGEKVADLPVQQPVKFEMVINLKTAKALGLTIPPNLLAIADEVIE
jgi:putative tryptophan/tyrosine transport system substrate-binding protein